jgi:excinuclease ABC subunit B
MEGAYAENSVRGRLFPKSKMTDETADYLTLSTEALTAKIAKLENQMYDHAHNLEFEEAAHKRDLIHKLKEAMLGR